MIDWEKFNYTYQYYGNEVVCEIIDIFEEEYEERMATLEQNISGKDFANIKFNAHSLKGVIANYMDPEPVEHARKLEELGENKIEEGLSESFEKLKLTSFTLLNELLKYRKTIKA
jgi:HPt (histidine-containing phosphotransfer) domain-containing protein